ncbi:uncharacterized protein At4g04775-like [Eutrema salsugineum]|uniref:uncharacterized protein At4g04775-like n=1 Tax=Eutrema salsugineum TaxID=72664 RepID=UPI000CED4263|nr:uncharacterized protein At4g04775-like [Eutrema salsugineum]
MSGASGSVSGSSGSSSSRPKRIVGVPKKCWCGEQIVALISKSDNNPYRRYFRCAYAASKKIVNDNHNFKWVDEALLDEIEKLQNKNSSLEQEIKESATDKLGLEKMIYEKVQRKLEKEIFDRVEDVLAEAKCGMRKMMMLVVVGFLLMLGIIGLVG